jgi:hypothetical protein
MVIRLDPLAGRKEKVTAWRQEYRADALKDRALSFERRLSHEA